MRPGVTPLSNTKSWSASQHQQPPTRRLRVSYAQCLRDRTLIATGYGPQTAVNETLCPTHSTGVRSHDNDAARLGECMAHHVCNTERRLRVQTERTRCQECRAVAAKNYVRNMIQKYNAAASAPSAALQISTGKPMELPTVWCDTNSISSETC